MPRLTEDELQLAPQQLRGWTVTSGALEKQFVFSTFLDAIAFVNRIADLAEDAAHYPSLLVVESRLTVCLTTPEEGGVTERDIHLARRIETLLNR
jgi:4a-hydroxytetrahydrobiopterin dehydratase